MRKYEVIWVSIVSPGSVAEDRRSRACRFFTRWGAERYYTRCVGLAIQDPQHNEVRMTRDGESLDLRPPRCLR